MGINPAGHGTPARKLSNIIMKGEKMNVIDATKKLIESSGEQGEAAKDFCILCYANLFVSLSERYGENAQEGLLDAAVKSIKQFKEKK